MLSNEEQDIIVMDVENKKLEPLENYNLLTYQGSAISFNDLNAIKTGACDLFIAVTKSEARNILSCSMAKRLGAKRTVARIDNDEFFNANWRTHFSTMGIDHLIYPEMLASKEISGALKRTWARNWFELFDGELIVVGVKIRKNARIVGKMLKEMSDISQYLHVSAIKRNREIIIPRGEDRVLENDIVYIETTLTRCVKHAVRFSRPWITCSSWAVTTSPNRSSSDWEKQLISKLLRVMKRVARNWLSATPTANSCKAISETLNSVKKRA